MRRFLQVFFPSIVLSAVIFSLYGNSTGVAHPLLQSTTTPYRIYFPLVGNQIAIAPSKLLVGSYTPGIGFTTQSEINTYLIALDNWSGMKHSLAGDFVDIQNTNAISVTIELRWQNGYTDFINLMTIKTAAQIAGGCCDAEISEWARQYKEWQNLGGRRQAFLAWMPEMNGNWTSYGYDPINFKSAWTRVRNLFAARGATGWWVFAPNNVSTAPYHFSDYYPGDANVDVIAFSAFNFGLCQAGTVWQSPSQVYGNAIDELQSIAGKPLIVAQTATASSGGDKEQWLRDAYAYLMGRGIFASIYFNGNKECDWAIYNSIYQSQGYKDAMQNAKYLPPPPLFLY